MANVIVLSQEIATAPPGFGGHHPGQLAATNIEAGPPAETVARSLAGTPHNKVFLMKARVLFSQT